ERGGDVVAFAVEVVPLVTRRVGELLALVLAVEFGQALLDRGLPVDEFLVRTGRACHGPLLLNPRCCSDGYVVRRGGGTRLRRRLRIRIDRGCDNVAAAISWATTAALRVPSR